MKKTIKNIIIGLIIITLPVPIFCEILAEDYFPKLQKSHLRYWLFNKATTTVQCQYSPEKKGLVRIVENVMGKTSEAYFYNSDAITRSEYNSETKTFNAPYTFLPNPIFFDKTFYTEKNSYSYGVTLIQTYKVHELGQYREFADCIQVVIYDSEGMPNTSIVYAKGIGQIASRVYDKSKKQWNDFWIYRAM